jgi:hypothetical protein
MARRRRGAPPSRESTALAVKEARWRCYRQFCAYSLRASCCYPLELGEEHPFRFALSRADREAERLERSRLSAGPRIESLRRFLAELGEHPFAARVEDADDLAAARRGERWLPLTWAEPTYLGLADRYADRGTRR